MNIKTTLYGLLMPAILCLSALPASAQTESLRNKVGELYDNGYADSWFSQALAKSYITNLCYQNLDLTADSDSIALTKEQKIRHAEQITELYASRNLRNDMINLLMANLPETCTDQLLSDYIKDKTFRRNDEYRITTGKILLLTTDSTLKTQVKAAFNAPLRKLAKAKAIKPSPLAVQACPESYIHTFASFWDKYDNLARLTNPIEDEMVDAATGIEVYAYYTPGDNASYNEARRELDKDSKKRRDKMEKYCMENAPIFWRNLFLEKGITEEGLLSVTPPLSAKILEDIKQLDQHMAKHQNYNKQALLKSFAFWYKKWRNNKDEDHSILTQESPTQTASIEEIAGTNDRIYEKVQASPKFPGEEKALMEWLSKNVHYPTVCQESGVQGRVYVSFVVEKDGSITNVKIMRSPDPAMSEETLRVLSKMPSWIPGTQDGEPVRVKFTLPIMFRLS